MKDSPRRRTDARADAHAAALRLIAGRELSARQILDRLARRGIDPAAARAAVDRLLHEGAIDDRRTALARARTALLVRRRGRLRAEREIEALGIPRETARSAVREVIGETGESALLEAALARRAPAGVRTAAEYRRLRGWLLRRGFPPDQVAAALRGRTKNPDPDGE